MQQNYKQAAYFHQSRRKGHNVAQYNLALCYEDGRGVLQNYKAVYWYTKAAKQGCVASKLNLASCYALGLGVSQDRIKAYAIILHAKLNGRYL